MEDPGESPLKLTTAAKRARYSVDCSRCIICQLNLKDQQLSTATDSGIKSLTNASQIRKDETFDRLVELLGDLDQPILSSDVSIRYHRTCVASYTSKRNLAFISKDANTPLATTSCPTRSSRNQFNWSNCVICKQKSYKKDKKLHRIETFERDRLLKEAADARGDEDMLLRVRGEDLIAREALYHNACMKQYLRNISSDTPVEKSSSHHDEAFHKFLSEIHDDLFVNYKVFLISDLLHKFKMNLPQDIADSYSAQKLQRRLTTHYGDSISVLNQSGQGQCNIILSSSITVIDAIKAARKLKESLKDAQFHLQLCSSSTTEQDNMKILHSAAGILRTEIEHFNVHDDYPAPIHISQEESVKAVPPLLFRFVQWIVSKAAFESVACTVSNETDRKCLALTECLFSCNKSVTTPLQLGLAVQLYHEFGSRKIIDTLSAFGFCVSYDELRRFLTSLAQQEAENIQDGIYVPSGIESSGNGGLFIHEGDDNVDINTETIDGKNTFHSMARAVFQERSLNHIQESARIPRKQDKSMKMTDTLEDLVRIQSFDKPIRKPEPPHFDNALDKMKACQISGSRKIDLSWILLRMLPRDVLPVPETVPFIKEQVTPFWTGYYHSQTEPSNSYTNVSYAPTINAKPNDMDTVFTTMKKCRDMTTKLGQQYAVQTMDQQLYVIAEQVKWSSPEQFTNHFIRLGGFHTLCCYISSLGKIWGDAGLRDLLCDSGVYAPATVDQMMQGKQFNRAVRGLTLVFEALASTWVNAFVKWCIAKDALKNIPLSFWEKLTETQRAFTLKNMPLQPLLEEITSLLHEHVDELTTNFTEECSAKSPTFRFWNDLLNAINVMLMNIKAERTGNWNMSLQSLCLMLPHIFVSDKMNYSRWLPVYILEMLHVPEDLKNIFVNGQFSVRQSAGRFNGVWSDMGTEKSVIKDCKGQGGIKGLTQQKSGLLRWSLTRHILGEYASHMQRRSGLDIDKTDTIHDEARPSALKRDEDHTNLLIKHLRENMTDPFDIDDHPNTLMNISTGLLASSDVQSSLVAAVQTGQSLAEKFIERTFDTNSNHSLYEPIKKSGLKTFTTMAKKAKVKSAGVTMNININPELIFRRALNLSNAREVVTSSTLMSHPIGPVPTSIFHDDGTMRKCTKADFGHKLEENVVKCTELPEYDATSSTLIRDVMAVIQGLPVNQYKTFDDLASGFLNQLLKSMDKSHTVIDVYDNYDQELSVKSAERMRRTTGDCKSKKTYQVIGGRVLPPWQKFLAVVENKKSLQHFLTGYITRYAPGRLQGMSRKLIIAGGFANASDVICISGEGTSRIQNLTSSQEEADTRIFVHVNDINESLKKSGKKGRVVLKSPDTDVLVLAVHYFPFLDHVSELWIQTGTASGVTDHRRFIPVHEICKALSPVMCDILPAVHAITGCDTVSSFFGIGKRSVYKIVTTKCDEFADLVALYANDVDAAVNASRHLVMKLYSQRHTGVNSLDDLRVKLSSQKNVSLAKLPPCEKSFKYQVKRAMWQAKQWVNAHVPCPQLGSPLDYGWKVENDTLVPILFEGPMASELLEDLICSCGSRRNSCLDKCSCRNQGLLCTDVCSCSTETCTNKFDSTLASDDEDEM